MSHFFSRTAQSGDVDPLLCSSDVNFYDSSGWGDFREKSTRSKQFSSDVPVTPDPGTLKIRNQTTPSVLLSPQEDIPRDSTRDSGSSLVPSQGRYHSSTLKVLRSDS